MAERTLTPSGAVGPDGAPMSALADDPLGSPAARRLRQPSWLDLRLVVGVLLVLISVVLGARIVAAADSSTRVWAVRADLAAGTTLTDDDVRVVRVRLFDDADRYLSAAASPAGRTISRSLGAGELLPRAALSGQSSGRLLSLPVPVGHAPDGLHRGQQIDVYATSKSTGTGPPGRTDRILTGVPVQGVRAPRAGLSGGSADYAVLIVVPPDDVSAVIAALRTAVIDVTVVTGTP
ncbi:MAG: SAF domain-containing protein [Actinomycetota bacterium]|nr:SAF domain-containing protein [Actinomycetota bacterium]